MARAKKETALTPEERLQAALVPDWEWPYKLPKNWCWTTVGTICDGFQYGYTEKATFEKIGPHFIRITDIGDGIINDSGAPYCKIDSDLFIKYKINKDDILIARMGSVGENGLATHNIDGVFASYLIRIVPRSNAKYVCNFLQTNLYWGQISEKAQGTTRLNVNANVLKNLIIPLPPLAEQQRIVDRIKSLFAKLDEAKEKAQAVVDSFETRKAAILHKAFTGELTAKWREEHGVGMESWEVRTLDSVCSSIFDGDHILFNDTDRFSLLYNNLKGRIVQIELFDSRIRFTVDVEIPLTEQDCQNDGIEFIDIIDDVTRIRFDVLDFEEEMADEDRKKAIVPFQLAYAVSIHKAQGLEYRSVKVVIPSSNAEKITHGIFYTAITRAKEKLKIYWSSETMQEVVAGFSVDTSRQKSLAIIKEKLKQDKNT